LAEVIENPILNSPSMKGFRWSHREIAGMPRGLPGNLWCVRDAFCALMGWVEGSADWNAFIEGPAPEDMDRLTAHLGLTWFDPDYGPHRAVREAALDHPGIACYKLEPIRLSHCAYEPHLRHLRGLPAAYAAFEPEFMRVIVDMRQPPHPGTA
jgi:hypothetical protein